MKLSDLNKWDQRFLALADHVSQWSKGPRKRVGAVIVRPDKSVASMGYNGPPRGFDDVAFLDMSRDEQHKVVVHAEINAFNQMSERDYHLNKQFTLYVSPLYPCEKCAEFICDSGLIKRIVSFCGQISPDWAESAKQSELLFKQYGIEYICVEG